MPRCRTGHLSSVYAIAFVVQPLHALALPQANANAVVETNEFRSARVCDQYGRMPNESSNSLAVAIKVPNLSSNTCRLS